MDDGARQGVDVREERGVDDERDEMGMRRCEAMDELEKNDLILESKGPAIL